MHLHGISLQNFRNTAQRTVKFPKQTTVIVGNNASGKTSIIEAISLLATGDSFRAEEVSEMVQFEAEIGRVKGIIEDEGEKTELEILLTRGVFDGKKVQSRLYSVNGVRRMKKDFVRKLFTVVFRPEDMRLVEGSPERRRQFVNTILCVTDHEYAASLKTYDDALRRRNRLLSQIQEGKLAPTVLNFWNNLTLKHGTIVQEKRRQFFATFAEVAFPMTFTIESMPSVISEDRMAEYAAREVAAGHTLIGPHKDDFAVKFMDQKSVALFGSRGQQRLAVLWLKMCELAYVTGKMGTQPLLLLDDILSELDLEHREYVVQLMHDRQTILTTTEEKIVAEIHVDDLDTIHL